MFDDELYFEDNNMSPFEIYTQLHIFRFQINEDMNDMLILSENELFVDLDYDEYARRYAEVIKVLNKYLN